MMLLWTAFSYFFHRLVCLTLKKKQMHSSALTDICARRCWGVPLSTVAAAWGFWGYRLGYLYSWLMPVMFFVSLELYVSCLEFIGTDGDDDVVDDMEENYSDVEEELLYSWFNCNPIHVLKSRYFPEQIPESMRAHCPFDYGKKELLQRSVSLSRRV